jgi:hypothetical protein
MIEIRNARDALGRQYHTLAARGARREYRADMDFVIMKLNTLDRNWIALSANPDAMWDVVVHIGTQVKPILNKIESKYATTRVAPYSTGEAGTALPSQLREDKTVDDLVADAPIGIGNKEGGFVLDEEIPWYYWNGMDLRFIGGAAAFLVIGGVIWRTR